MPTMTALEGPVTQPSGALGSCKSGASAKHNAVLAGLRGLAILAVMLYHFTGGYKGNIPLLHAWALIAGAGWMGVDLFFVLSGFLITGILYDTIHAEHRVRNFYARRSLRIFPLFYAVLFGLFFLSRPLQLHWRPEHLVYFTYLSNVVLVFLPHFQPPSHWVNLGHLWSLAVEEQFYLIWPFVVWTVRRRGLLLKIIFTALLAGPIVRGLLLLKGMDPSTMTELLWTRGDSLLFGAAASLLVRGTAEYLATAKAILIGSILLIAVCIYAAGGPIATSYWFSTIGYSALAAFSASIIYFAQQGARWTSLLFNRPLLQFFGRYSYGLYLFHGLYFVYLRNLTGALESRLHSGVVAQLLIVLVGFALSILLAMLSYHYFEAPILKLKSRFT